MTEKLVKTEEEWKRQLTPEQYRILREKGTERALTGRDHATNEAGTYQCVGCRSELCRSATKFDSGSGWPSFYQPVASGQVETHDDLTHGMRRTEVTCSRCGGHLGHVF